MERMRIEYDEYILYVDAEFSRLYEMLEQRGILENTILILTTDHGEIPITHLGESLALITAVLWAFAVILFKKSGDNEGE